MYLLNSFALSRLNNAEVTAFYINVQKAITAVTAAKLGLATDLMATYDETLTRLVDQVYTAQSSPLTATMQAADAKRTQVMKRIRLRLQLVLVGDDVRSISNAREAVETHLLTKYTADIASMAMQQKTAVITGFINDCRTKLTEDDIETLGIDNDLTTLANANAAFIAAYNQRTTERASAEMQVTQRLRQQMYQCYVLIGLSVQYLANDTAEANAEKATACQAFIAVLNVLVADVKKRYLQRMGRLSADESQPASPDDQPADDKADSDDPDDAQDDDKPNSDNPEAVADDDRANPDAE